MGCKWGVKMKRKSNKLAALERKRWSVFTDNLKKCYFCDNPKNDLHEIFQGSNRKKSMEWGYVLPVCRFHHECFKNTMLALSWQVKCQELFIEEFSLGDWIDTFHKNYKERLNIYLKEHK